MTSARTSLTHCGGFSATVESGDITSVNSAQLRGAYAARGRSAIGWHCSKLASRTLTQPDSSLSRR